MQNGQDGAKQNRKPNSKPNTLLTFDIETFPQVKVSSFSQSHHITASRSLGSNQCDSQQTNATKQFHNPKLQKKQIFRIIFFAMPLIKSFFSFPNLVGWWERVLNDDETRDTTNAEFPIDFTTQLCSLARTQRFNLHANYLITIKPLLVTKPTIQPFPSPTTLSWREQGKCVREIVSCTSCGKHGRRRGQGKGVQMDDTQMVRAPWVRMFASKLRILSHCLRLHKLVKTKTIHFPTDDNFGHKV